MGKIDLHFWIFEIDLVLSKYEFKADEKHAFFMLFLCTDLSHLSVSIWLPTLLFLVVHFPEIHQGCFIMHLLHNMHMQLKLHCLK